LKRQEGKGTLSIVERRGKKVTIRREKEGGFSRLPEEKPRRGTRKIPKKKELTNGRHVVEEGSTSPKTKRNGGVHVVAQI